MKKNILILLIVLISQSVLFSCKYYADDPFLTDTDTQTGADTGVNTIIETETEAKKESPDDDFYALTDKQSYDKYGCVTQGINQHENYTDGVSFYFETNKIDKTNGSLILAKMDYPLGKTDKVSPVCTNPLCKHTAGSGCPFDGSIPGLTTIYADHLYFPTSNGLFKVYDFKTNKSTVLLDHCLTPRLYKNDGNLYYQYYEEPLLSSENLTKTKVFVKIEADGKLTELGRLEEYDSEYDIIYKDRYVIQSFYDKKEKKIYVYSHDLTTKDTETVCEFECEDIISFMRAVLVMKYGDKVLIDIAYNTKKSGARTRNYVYLLNLATKEKELVCTPDYDTYKTSYAYCLHSEKCIVWYEPRPGEDTPFILHIYFPKSGETETYNLSEMAEKIGAVIPLDDYLTTIETGAIKMKRYIDPNSVSSGSVKTFEFDLASGRVYKYDAPAA